MDLNHLNLRVRDPEACRDFYVRWFGFAAHREHHGGWFLRNDDGFLLALLPAGDHPAALPPGVHVGFNLADAGAAAVEALHAALVAAGADVGALEDERPDEDYVTFRCWDPAGTEVEVFWEPLGD